MFAKNPKYTVSIVFITVLLDLLSFGILIPVIPELLVDANSKYFMLPAGMSIDMGYILLGFLVGAFPLAQFLFAPLLGELSDRYGRRPILIGSLFGTAISFFIFAFAILTKNLPLLFASRVLDGATGGNLSVAQAVIADVTKQEDRSKNFALIGAAFGIGFIIGPFLGGVLSNSDLSLWFNSATPFWFAGALSLFNTILVYVFLPETSPMSGMVKIMSVGKSILHVFKAFTTKGLRSLYATNFLFQSGFTFYTTFLGVYLIEKFGFNESDIGNYFAYVGITMSVLQVVVTRNLSRRFSEEKILSFSLLIASLGILAYYIPTGPKGLFIVAPFLALGVGLTMANLTGLVSRRAPHELQGEILGINISVQALAQAVPPIIAGFIAAKATSYAPIFTASVVVFVSWFVFVSTLYLARRYRGLSTK